MKKLLFLVLAMAVAFSCQKKDQDLGPATADVVFGIQKVDPNDGLKATTPPDCPTDGNGVVLVPDHAEIYINDGVTTTMYSPTVFELNGMLYTQAIKLPAANGSTTTYTVEDFLLFQGTTLIMATPGASGDYSEYVTKTVPFNFDVEAFEKAEEPVEVLCYLPETYDYFGFTWFEITEIVVREFCFFGDICLNGEPFSPADFNGSMYGSNLGIDVPAIMQIVVKDENGIEVPNSPFNNEAWLGIGDPLCVQYPDDLGETEVFTFELYLWLKTDAGWSYQLYHTYTSTDGGALMFDGSTVADVDDNGVVEFVLGTCNYSDTDHTFAWVCPSDYYQPFNSDDGDWFDYPGPMTISGGQANVQGGAFTRFDGYLSVWPGTWTAEIDVYLDPAWVDGEGFDYTVSANGSDNNHQRDYIFHVGSVSGYGLLVNGSNNTDGTFNSYKLLNENGGNYYTVTTAGWYTLQHVFYNSGGALAVDLNLLNSGGSQVWTATRYNAGDLIPDEVGGNRYGWFIFVSVPGGIDIDEAELRRDCNL